MDAKTKLTWIVLVVSMSAMILAFSCSKASCAEQDPILSKMTIEMFFTDSPDLSPEENLKYRAESIMEFMDILCFSYYSALIIHGLSDQEIGSQLKLYVNLGRSILIPVIDQIEKSYHTGKIPHDSNFCSVFAGHFFPYLAHIGVDQGLDRYRLVPNPNAKGNL